MSRPLRFALRTLEGFAFLVGFVLAAPFLVLACWCSIVDEASRRP